MHKVTRVVETTESEKARENLGNARAAFSATCAPTWSDEYKARTAELFRAARAWYATCVQVDWCDGSPACECPDHGGPQPEDPRDPVYTAELSSDELRSLCDE